MMIGKTQDHRSLDVRSTRQVTQNLCIKECLFVAFEIDGWLVYGF